MKKNFIDETVRKKLKDVDIPFDAASWQALEQKIESDADLSVDGSPEDAFDTVIKSALTSDIITSIPMNWDTLKARMDLDPDLIPNSADQPYRDALEHVEVPYTPAAWDMMEAQLDLDDNLADLESDDVVDQTVYNKINNLQVPYDAESWQSLSDKLDGIGILRQRIVYRYKAAELLLFLLLLVTITNFLPFTSTTTHTDHPIVASPVIHQHKSDDSTNALNGESSEITPLFAESNLVKPKNALTLNSTSQAEEVTNTNVNLGQTNDGSKAKQEVSLTNSADIIVNITKEDIQQSRTIENTELASKSFPLVMNEQETSSSLRYKLLTDDQRMEMGLALLPIVPSNLVDFAIEKPVYNCITCTAPKTMRIYASMFLMGDFNYILTPFDRTFQVDAYSNGSIGYGIGSTVAFSYGKWELETGAIFNTKIYEPTTLLTETIGDFETGYVSLSLKQIELNILQVPLHIRYNFDKSKNWNVYASAGASLQVAVFKNSDFDSDYTARPSLERSTSRQSLQEIINENSTFNEQRFSDGGWFEEGGTFIENRYFTANIGVGIERSLGSRWSVFTQTMYQHTLLSNGFGPKNDRINTVSVLVGARTQFGSKINTKR